MRRGWRFRAIKRVIVVSAAGVRVVIAIVNLPGVLAARQKPNSSRSDGWMLFAAPLGLPWRLRCCRGRTGDGT